MGAAAALRCSAAGPAAALLLVLPLLPLLVLPLLPLLVPPLLPPLVPPQLPLLQRRSPSCCSSSRRHSLHTFRLNEVSLTKIRAE